MLFDIETLQIIWWCLAGVLLIGFALTGGMDMAVSSMLFAVCKNTAERDRLIATIVPHWDGNQVWLITAGGAVFAAWPEVYAASFSGLYWAMILVLASVWLRPLAFDYRERIESEAWKKRWDIALSIGSAIPLVIFGVAFGNLLQGLPFYADENVRWHYDGYFLTALLPLLNPFALLCGVVSLLMLMTHGSMWIQLRCSGAIKQRAAKLGSLCAAATAVLFLIAGVVAWNLDGFVLQSLPPEGSYHLITGKTVIRQAHGLFGNYLSFPPAVIVPALAVISLVAAVIHIKKQRLGKGILSSSLAVATIIVTPALALFPFIMPSSIDLSSSLTVFDSSSSQFTLSVMLASALIFVPIALAYTIWAYVKMWRVEAEQI